MTQNTVFTFITYEDSVILGKGDFGFVFPGTWKNSAGVRLPVAVKRIFLGNILSGPHDVTNVRNLSHPNIVKLYDILDDNYFR